MITDDTPRAVCMKRLMKQVLTLIMSHVIIYECLKQKKHSSVDMGVNTMSLDTLKTAKKVIGIKQVTKAVKKDLCKKVFIAQDADLRVVQPLKDLCEQHKIDKVDVATMSELGEACTIEVGAAAVAVLK
ncbi:MAG: ribosomal protein L7Ae/L30e/S12e/Gadd45 [Massilibacillus sp.]|jgi:large subunit ribosomal protein L7A|nr:ribosomal protein L7Ae/L30e/S12e/Gadd45 [Massilibacillus sp.]